MNDPLPGTSPHARMAGENIVCFAKDWTEDPTSNNHVMRMLARRNRVLWLNSISMRAPALGNRGDLGKIRRKIAQYAGGPKRVKDDLHVFTPLVLPFPHNRMAIAANRRILKADINRHRRRFDMEDFQLWAFLPNSVEYFGMLGEQLRVYYCTDEFSQFSYMDGKAMVEKERRLMEQADIVFTTSRSLLEAKRPFNRETHLASHGVDHAHFATALEGDAPVAPELAGLKGPIIGFFGFIHDWIDIDLVAHVARRRPDWNIVMIGRVETDIALATGLPNVHWIGRRTYESLPAYCRGFSLGIIPFRINELTRHVNPIKLREYLSAGLPVVSTALPEVELCGDWCSVAHDPEEFIALCEQAILADSPEARRARSAAMQDEDWEHQIARIEANVMRVKRARHGTTHEAAAVPAPEPTHP